jgi:hypothetical protein
MKATLSLFGLLVFLAGPALAQPQDGDVGLVFDLGFTQPWADPPLFTTTNEFYVLGYNLSGDVAAYEFQLTADPRIVLFSSTDLANPEGSVNTGLPPYSWIVDVGACVSGDGIVPLVQLIYGVFDATARDLTICIGPTTQSSFSPPSPGYRNCAGELARFGIANHGGRGYPDGCAVVYGDFSPLAAGATSWGAMKVRF